MQTKIFQKTASLLSIHLSVIRTHTLEQNNYVVSFHSTLKRKYIWSHGFSNYQEAEVVISEAFRNYNHPRLRSAPYVPPDKFFVSWEAM